MFEGIENKYDVYKDDDCMRKFYESLKKCSMEINNFAKEKMISLTNDQYESYLKQINCHICEKMFVDKYANDIKL